MASFGRGKPRSSSSVGGAGGDTATDGDASREVDAAGPLTPVIPATMTDAGAPPRRNIVQRLLRRGRRVSPEEHS